MKVYQINKPKPPHTKKYTNVLELEPEDSKVCAGCGVNLAIGEMVRVQRKIKQAGRDVKTGDKLGKIYCYDCQSTEFVNVTGHLCLLSKIHTGDKD